MPALQQASALALHAVVGFALTAAQIATVLPPTFVSSKKIFSQHWYFKRVFVIH
jgi:hypothetical protein